MIRETDSSTAAPGDMAHAADTPPTDPSGGARRHGEGLRRGLAARILDHRRAALFITGAATLALQLVASRILTPYFGVSLYIWTGILAVTLVALAAGYALGGRLSDRRRPSHADGLFGAAPAVAGICLSAGALVYPNLFPLLARLDLAVGAILAAVVLLGPALVVLAAMNPLLVATVRAEKADAGSGNVFAWSTAGSVAGVLIAAFVLIPYLMNFSSLLIVAVIMAGVSVVWAAFSGRRRAMRYRAIKAAVFAVLLAALAQMVHFGLPGGAQGGSAYGYTSVDVRPSALGAVRVIDIPASAGGTDRVMLLDGMNMGMQRLPAGEGAGEGQVGAASIGFPHALAAIARQSPRAQRVLVLGLGAGSAPMMLADDGRVVHAVEISPAVTEVAVRHFGFNARRVPVREMDARIFARRCPGDDGRRYDAILVDLFAGDGIPDHLVTWEFLDDLRSCLTPGGTIAFNTFLVRGYQVETSDLLATVISVFGRTSVVEDLAAGSVIGNTYLISPPLADPGSIIFPEAPDPGLRDRLLAAFAGARTVSATDLRGATVLTDERNRFAVTARQEEVSYRQHIVNSLPPALLLN